MRLGQLIHAASFIFVGLTIGATVGCTPGSQQGKPSPSNDKKNNETAAINTFGTLYKLTDYQNREYPIETKKPIANPKLNLSSSTYTDLNQNGEPLFPVVEYSTKAPFIINFNRDKFPLTAKANTSNKYSFVFRLTDSHLVVYKKALSEDLPEQERKHAIREGLHFLVPQFSYAIKLFSVDENGLPTPVAEISRATDFIVDNQSAQFLELKSRQFVLPKTFFDGEWFFAATVIEKKSDGIGRYFPAGSDLTADFSLNAVSRVKFQVDEYRLAAKNMNIDNNLLADSKINQEDVIVIAGESVDFRMRPTSGGMPSLQEEVLDNNHPHSQPWGKRKYLKLQFDKVSTLATWIFQDKGEFGDAMLLDLNLSSDYIGFTIQYNTNKVVVRYSFKRASGVKPGRLAFEKDMRHRFGFFTTMKHFVPGPQDVRESDFAKNDFINRFYPEKSKSGRRQIIYHFSKNSPKNPSSYRDAAREAIRQWNVAFTKAGTGIEVVLDESFDVDLGDIRYNIINLIDEKTGGGRLLGYGPSIADTKSGEIISATANIYINSFRSSLIYSLRNYVYFKIDKIKDESVYESSGILKSLRKSLSDIGVANDKIEKLLTIESAKTTPIASSASIQESSKGRVSSCQKFSVSKSDLIKSVEQLCKDDLLNYIDKLNAINNVSKDKITNIEGEEYPALASCAEKLVVGQLLETLLHELGHNFGLRHNFLASVDKSNFIKSESSPSFASSVMDYLPPNAPVMLELGPYDVAALKYGYANKVEVIDSNGVAQDVSINDKQDLETFAVSSTNKLKPYMFCTDEDASSQQFSQSALCARWDFGTTPLEIINNRISDFNSMMSSIRYRFDLIGVPLGTTNISREEEHLAQIFHDQYVIPMLRIYAEWRLQLAKLVGDKSRVHLFSFTKEGIKDLLKKSAQKLTPESENSLLSYFVAGQNVADFLMSISFLPSRQCIAELEDGSLYTESFSNLVGQAETIDEVLKDCNDPLAVKFISQKTNTKIVNVFGAGHFLENVQTTKDFRNKSEYYKPDVVGIAPLITKAIEGLRYAESFSVGHDRLKLNPVILQEPQWREVFIQKMNDRLLNGLSSKELKINASLPPFLEVFQDLSDINYAYANALRTALNPHEEPVMQRSLSREFGVYREQKREEVLDAAVTWSPTSVGNENIVFAMSSNRQAQNYINRYFELVNYIEILSPSADGDEPLPPVDLATEILSELSAEDAELNLLDAKVIDVFDALRRFSEIAEGNSDAAVAMFELTVRPILRTGAMMRVYKMNHLKFDELTLREALIQLNAQNDIPKISNLSEMIKNVAAESIRYTSNRTEKSAQTRTLELFLNNVTFEK